ncbi:MAG: hypothetical protein JWM46_457 [Candidatus Kaiserbacteria bacterium]|nr:hypothetical protein [Candidatus Kaiserbacteria bacterium]
MDQQPVSEFFKFALGFLVFITVSFGVTFAVNSYSISQSADQQAAAAIKAMLEPLK